MHHWHRLPDHAPGAMGTASRTLYRVPWGRDRGRVQNQDGFRTRTGSEPGRVQNQTPNTGHRATRRAVGFDVRRAGRRAKVNDSRLLTV